MYPQNNLGAGAQWQFATIIVVVLLALTLGVMSSNSELLHPSIADATAEGITKKDDIEHRRGLIDLEKYQNEALIAIERAWQALENEKRAAQQAADFRQEFHQTVNFGLRTIFVAISIVLVVFGIMSALKIYKSGWSQIEIARGHSKTLRHQPSPAALMARQREQKKRQEYLAIKHTHSFWPDHNQQPERDFGNLPWAN